MAYGTFRRNSLGPSHFACYTLSVKMRRFVPQPLVHPTDVTFPMCQDEKAMITATTVHQAEYF